MSRPYYVKYLDRHLRAYKKSNLLKENLHVLLSSLSVVSLLRLFTIIDMSIVTPMW